VPAQNSFDFATIRVVPRVDREEFVNAGVIVFCLGQKFLRALVHVDESRLSALWPELDLNLLRENLAVFPKICSGAEDGGPIAKLSLRERFHWLVAPRSTVIQISPVHSGLCEAPESVLEELFRQLVLR
jgi:hypothetical protein